MDVMAAAREVAARAAVAREVADMAAERAAAAQEAQEALVASGPVPAEEDLPP